MARPKKGSTTKQSGEGPEAGTAADNGPAAPATLNKKQMVQRALEHLGRKAERADIRDFIKREFKTEMNLNHISNYKTALKKGGKSRKGRRRAAPAAANGTERADDILKDIRAIKALIERLGSKKFHELVELILPARKG